MQPRPVCHKRGEVFRKDGLFYARLERLFDSEPLEVVLHGVVSEDQARAALDVLSTLRRERRSSASHEASRSAVELLAKG